jgi:hypothetical protein
VFGRDPSPTTATLPLWISSGLGLLAGKLGVGFATVARIWRGWNLHPWRVETFKFSTDPQLEAKVRDVVGLCLHPPENAVVLCLDEKSQVQALQRTAPILPIMPGVPEKATHDYIRNGTTTLFAALEVATGKALPNSRISAGNWSPGNADIAQFGQHPVVARLQAVNGDPQIWAIVEFSANQDGQPTNPPASPVWGDDRCLSCRPEPLRERALRVSSLRFGQAVGHRSTLDRLADLCPWPAPSVFTRAR